MSVVGGYRSTLAIDTGTLHRVSFIIKKKKMGVLDDHWLEEPKNKKEPKNYDDSTIAINCDFCGNVFHGQAWMRETNKKVNCRDCWKKGKAEEL